MNANEKKSREPQSSHSIAAEHPTPGKGTQIDALLVQMRASRAPEGDVREAAAAGVSTPSTSLPHLDKIQASFGPERDVSSIHAHVGGLSAASCADIGATAYATGNHVAFASSPDLHTAAHEAAHVEQQKTGVSLYGGVGRVGDEYERHADAVADRVVEGQSAVDLLAPPARTAGESRVQRKEAEPSATAGMHVEQSPDRQVFGIVLDAARFAEAALARANAGQLGADAACLSIAAPTREALDAMQRYTAMRLARGMVEGAEQHEERTALERALDLLVASSLHLIEKAKSEPAPTGGAGSVGAPTLASLLQQMMALAPGAGFKIPGTIEEMDARVAEQNACPAGSEMEGRPGCNLGDADRRELRGKIRGQLSRAGNAFFDECKKESAALEAAIEKDAKWAEILTDTLIAALAAAGAGVLAAGAEATARTGVAAAAKDAAPAVATASDARAASNAVTTYGGGATKAATDAIASAAGEGAKEGSRGLDFFKDSLKDIAKASATAVSPVVSDEKSGDPRVNTLTMIERLGDDVVTALGTFADGGLEQLTDSALNRLYGNLYGAGATEPYATAARMFIAKFAQQVAPLDTVDYKDPRMWGMRLLSSPIAGTVAAWVVGAGSVPRLAVVKEVGDTMANTMTGEMPPQQLVNASEYDFVAWVEPEFVEKVAPRAKLSLSASDITGMPSGGERSAAP